METSGDLTDIDARNTPPDPPTISGPSTAIVGQPVTFTASGTDPDGDPLQFFWGMPAGCKASGPGRPNQGPTLTCTFTAPGAVGISLVSNDGTAGSTGLGTKVVRVRALSKSDCKNGGWRSFPGFKNQGQCVAFVERGPKH